MNWTETLVKWISSFDDEYPKVVEPANKYQVSTLPIIMNTKTPIIYEDFLHVMGAYDGGLFHRMRANFRISAVLKYCVELKSELGDHIFSECIPIATGDVFEGLGLAVESDPQNPPVFLLEDGLADSLVSKSFPVLAYQQAFLYERASRGMTASYEGFSTENTLEAAHAITSKIGFSPEWFCDASLYCARRGELMLAASIGGGNGELSICLTGANQNDVTTVGSIISKMMHGRLALLFREPTLPEVRASGGAGIEILWEDNDEAN